MNGWRLAALDDDRVTPDPLGCLAQRRCHRVHAARLDADLARDQRPAVALGIGSAYKLSPANNGIGK